MRVQNSQGTIWYGLHFYPGVAEYQEAGKEPYRVFLNEDTIRAMDPSFAGRPVYVHHVEDVKANVDDLRGEVDGWVIESFFNAADGKHWAKFIVCSEKGLEAIRRGWKLSNCYIAKSTTNGGLWNGVQYAREITKAEYEHLAIIPNPRYEESDILTPEQFKAYNEAKLTELQRIANDDKREGDSVKFFKRQKVENKAGEIDLAELSVVLTKSGREVTITQMVNEADAAEMAKKEKQMANGDHFVKHGEEEMTVNELMGKYAAACNELADCKSKLENDPDFTVADEPQSTSASNEGEDDDKKKENEDDEDEKKKKEKEEKDEKKENAKNPTADELEKRRKAKEKADRLRNAQDNALDQEVARVEIGQDQLKRGKARYGSV